MNECLDFVPSVSDHSVAHFDEAGAYTPAPPSTQCVRGATEQGRCLSFGEKLSGWEFHKESFRGELLRPCFPVGLGNLR
jgi:hypothetical protein